VLHYANVFGKREVDDSEAMVRNNVRHPPQINEQLKNLRWMIDHVGLPEWVEKGREALKKLEDHRDRVRREERGQ